MIGVARQMVVLGSAFAAGTGIVLSASVSITRRIASGRPSATVHVGATAFLGVEVPSHVVITSPATRPLFAAADPGTTLMISSPERAFPLAR